MSVNDYDEDIYNAIEELIDTGLLDPDSAAVVQR